MGDLASPAEMARQGIARVPERGAPGISADMRAGLLATMMRFVRPALAQAEQIGRTGIADATLVATLTVHRDGNTSCRLRFGDGVRFREGEAAVQQAIAGLRAEAAEAWRCPASPQDRAEEGRR